LNIRTPQSTFVEFGEAIFSGHPELFIEYLSTSIRESILGIPIIHIEELKFPLPSIYQLYITASDRVNPNTKPSFTVNSSNIRGIGFSVRSTGNYSILYESLSPFERGYLIHDSLNFFSSLADNDTFYPNASFVANPTSPSDSIPPDPSPFSTEPQSPSQSLSFYSSYPSPSSFSSSSSSSASSSEFPLTFQFTHSSTVTHLPPAGGGGLKIGVVIVIIVVCIVVVVCLVILVFLFLDRSHSFESVNSQDQKSSLNMALET
jgi:hypothetical protein